MVCKTSAIYSDVIYLYICTTVVLLRCFLECILLGRKNVDDSGFLKDTRQTIEVVWLPCVAIRSLEDNDGHMWAI